MTELVTALGIVYRDLGDHLPAMLALCDDPCVCGLDLSVRAPLFKGSAAIKEGLAAGPSLRGKLEVYWRLGVVDEVARVAFAAKLRQQLSARGQQVERADVFVASGDVLVFQVELLPPMQLPVPREALDAIARGPHDKALLSVLRSGDSVDRALWRVEVRVFLDHALNPRRHLDREVQEAAEALDAPRPYVLEVSAGAGVAGYAHWVLGAHVEAAGGKVVWLQI